jgi:hypothetical protein
MGIRSFIVRLLFAVIMTVIPVCGYAFNLSQMLGGAEEQNFDTFKLIHVADLKALLANGGKVHVYDANSDVTREKFGTIPGAILLASDTNYPLSLLPSNKHALLIFYCADNH